MDMSPLLELGRGRDREVETKTERHHQNGDTREAPGKLPLSYNK